MKPVWTQEAYLKAWNFAAIAHEGQTYGSPDPGVQINYLNHLGSVAMELIWALSSGKTLYNENLAIQCALLHDTLEDTKVTYSQIEREFGDQVAQGAFHVVSIYNIHSYYLSFSKLRNFVYS